MQSELIGQRIQEWRKAKDWSQEETARRLGISTATWSRIENGLIVPNIDRLDAIAKLFRRPLVELLDSPRK